SRNMVKSNASSVQPSQPAVQAIHWSFVGSRHQGMVAWVGVAPAAALIVEASPVLAGGAARRGGSAGGAAFAVELHAAPCRPVRYACAGACRRRAARGGYGCRRARTKHGCATGLAVRAGRPG